MDNSIIVAIISLIGTFGGSWLGVLQANKLVNYRIGELEEKVNKHNNLIDRMYKVESRVTLIEDEIRILHK
jgi:hypothetical protein